MVSLRKALGIVSGLALGAGTVAACQSIAGIEDKELDPSLENGGSGGSGGSVDAQADVADAGSEDAGRGAHPPPRPAGDVAPSGGTSLTFAARRFYLGTVDPEDDATQLDAWREFGFDYDGECTTRAQSENDSSKTCLQPYGSHTLSLEDGNDCRDNTVGHILSYVLGLTDKSFEKKVHQGTITGADPTIIVQIDDVDAASDDPYAPGRIYVSAPTDAGMLWDGKDLMAVDRESVVDGGLGTSKYEFPDAYIKNDTWVSGDFRGPPMIIPIMVLNQIAPVPARTATLAVQLDSDHTKARGAVLAGALSTPGLEPLLRLGMLEATGCDPDATQYAMDLFLPNRDLANEDGFVNASEECGLMSIALGLELKRIKPPVAAVEVPPLPSSCDAGSD